MGNKFLLISATHGDEGFSVSPLERIAKKYSNKEFNYDWTIGNPEALKSGQRFIDADLNRVAPGNLKSKVHEEKRAAEIINLSANYRFLIDIHGTNANSGIFIIITNPKLENLLLAATLPIKNVVIWAAKESLALGPHTQFAKCPAVEIECGPKNSQKIGQDLEKIITQIINKPNMNFFEILNNVRKQKYFRVYGKLEDLDTGNLKEFKLTKIKKEFFYPLLVNSYKKGSTRKMKSLDLFDILSY